MKKRGFGMRRSCSTVIENVFKRGQTKENDPVEEELTAHENR
jgi:hypothetical protein